MKTVNNIYAFVRARRDLGYVPIAEDATDRVRDLIMQNAPSDEPLHVSVSRLCRAVGYMRFPCVSVFAAWLAYRKFPHLGEVRHGRQSA